MSEDYYKKIFSNNLLKLMKTNNISQSDIIRNLHVNKFTISTWCNGTRLPRMNMINKLAKYFNVKKSELIEEHSDSPFGDYYENVEYLKDKPDLLELYKEIVKNDQLVLLFDKARKLEPRDLEQVLKIIDTFNKETR